MNHSLRPESYSVCRITEPPMRAKVSVVISSRLAASLTQQATLAILAILRRVVRQTLAPA